jgi:hypothetical protein
MSTDEYVNTKKAKDLINNLIDELHHNIIIPSFESQDMVNSSKRCLHFFIKVLNQRK